MNTHRERELKFDVPDGYVVPDLGDLAGAAARTGIDTVRIVSTYYDTADRALLDGGLTLRKREGEVDAGWQLKVRAGSARTEIGVPPQAGADVPERLRGLLAGVLRGRPVRPIAVIRTERGRHRLVADDRLLLEVADDRVHGTALGDEAVITSWREVEAELGPAGDERLLRRAAELLTAAGAVPAPAPSKLARTLAVAPPSVPTDAPSAVRDYARQQWQAMVAGDIALRRGLDRVHKTRVAVRRFRSMLRVLGPALDARSTAELDAELSWYQNLLGDVRDRQVQRARFAARLAELPPEDVLGPVGGHIEQSLLAEQARHREELGQALDSARYLTLLDEVAAWVSNPPLASGFDERQLRKVVRKARRKARRRLAAGLAGDDPALLHRARKAAKRARYATELAQPIRGRKAKRQVKHLKHVQDVLGEHQDSVVARQLLRRLGTGPQTTDGPQGFTLGLLYGIEQAATRDARAAAARLGR